MLDRNRRIKPRPERFQDAEEEFDLVVTAEERVYDQVIECKFWYVYNTNKDITVELTVRPLLCGGHVGSGNIYIREEYL